MERLDVGVCLDKGKGARVPGSNAGTGRPLWFRCSACRQDFPNYWPGVRSGRQPGYSVKLTGRSKAMPPGRTGIRNSARSREYTCNDCGYIGWSRHVDLERRADA